MAFDGDNNKTIDGSPELSGGASVLQYVSLSGTSGCVFALFLNLILVCYDLLFALQKIVKMKHPPYPHTLPRLPSCLSPHHTTHPQTLTSLSVHLRTMPTCGIQSLTILLCVVLILSTGAIIGGFTLSTWDDLLEKARDTGDEGFGMCLDSGTADIETVSARYLRSVLGNVDTAVKEYLRVPEQLVVTLATLVSAHHPNVSTSPDFSSLVRPALLSAYRAGDTSGLQQMSIQTYPWSPAHPVPWKRGDGFAGWGSRVGFGAVDEPTGVTPADGTKVLLMYEMRNPATLAVGISDFTILTECTDTGEFKNPTQRCNPYPNYNLGQVRGMCIFPMAAIEPPGSPGHQARGRQLYYLSPDEPPLNPTDTLFYSALQVQWASMSWELTYTFTHPDMYTMHPKQGKRVGCVVATVTAKGVTDVVRAQLLPKDTSLYVVEEDHASGSVGELVAYNRGRQLRMERRRSPIGTLTDMAASFNVTNHSMEDATSHIPSVIAEHGRFVFTHPQNYRDLVEKTEDSFLKWSDSNGTEFWTITSTIEHKTILWYSTLLVPRASVMDTIDASTNAIRAKVASDLSSADTQKEDAVTVMAGVTAVAITGLLAIAVVFTSYITSPLLKLGSEMASVAVMDLEAVDTGRAVSQLSEVGMMQRSFVTMVANLVEYRNYMPQSVLVNDTEKEGSVSESSRDVRTRSGMSSPTRSTRSSVVTLQYQKATQSSVVEIQALKALLRVEGMKKKKVSLAHMNVLSWHAFIKKHKDAEVLSAHAGVIDRILTAVEHNKGVCDTFSGDKMLATFNAFVPKSLHSVACVQAAHEVATALGDVHTISYGCTTGEARVGNMGCNGMKKVSILSQSMSWVVVLERWNKKFNLFGVVDRNVSREAEGQVVLQCAGAVMYKKFSDKVQPVYAVKGLCSSKNEEWMYQLESASNNPHALWNEVFEHIIRQDFKKASSLLDNVAEDQRTLFTELVGYVRERTYAPHVVLMH